MLIYTLGYTRLRGITQGFKGYIRLHMVALGYTRLHLAIIHEGTCMELRLYT